MTEPELSVVLTDDAHIQILNAQWRDEDKATDVLSFPLYEPFQIPKDAPAIGDIVISIEYAEQTCEDAVHLKRMEESMGESIPKWELLEEITFLLIHGLLHLVGHDHETKDEEQEMKMMEIKLWKALN